MARLTQMGKTEGKSREEVGRGPGQREEAVVAHCSPNNRGLVSPWHPDLRSSYYGLSPIWNHWTCDQAWPTEALCPAWATAICPQHMTQLEQIRTSLRTLAASLGQRMIFLLGWQVVPVNLHPPTEENLLRAGQGVGRQS